jgi:hypothetical protein
LVGQESKGFKIVADHDELLGIIGKVTHDAPFRNPEQADLTEVFRRLREFDGELTHSSAAQWNHVAVNFR